MTANPLRGPNPPELGGPRFLDLSEPYDRSFLDVLQQQGAALGISSSLRTGTYAAVSGPTYETPAETRMLRAIGADAVGMSTVPEVIAARHVGVRVVGISCITNLACGISHDGQVAKVTHEEVMENITLGMEKMKQLLLASVPLMQQQQQQQQQPAATEVGQH
jgi:purine-nucleoside phosphorylase